MSLGFRRGWTHGVLAMAVLPLALAALLLFADRWIARRRGRPARARAGPLVALSYLAVLTHPALDWLNTYGIRLLMPFDSRWFYGDALFIIDPWLWLVAETAVVLAYTRSVLGITAWFVVGLALTALLSGFAVVPPASRLVWVVGVASIAGVRAWGGRHHLPRIAAGCLACAVVYILAMVGGSRVAARQATVWLAERNTVPVAIMAGPLPANPFARDIVVVDREHYHFVEVNWLQNERIRVSSPAIDRGPRGPIVDAAMTAPHVQGIKTSIRFPAYGVEELTDGYRVTIRDIRFARFAGAGLGDAVVELDRNLEVRTVRHEGNGPGLEGGSD